MKFIDVIFGLHFASLQIRLYGATFMNTCSVCFFLLSDEYKEEVDKRQTGRGGRGRRGGKRLGPLGSYFVYTNFLNPFVSCYIFYVCNFMLFYVMLRHVASLTFELRSTAAVRKSDFCGHRDHLRL